MGGTRILLVRHGEVEANATGRFVGSADPPLTAQGRRQAGELGRRLASVPLDAVLSSPLLRARDTAAAIASPHDLAVRIEDRLREQDYGVWEGRQLTPPYPPWLSEPDRAPEGGESFAEVARRTLTLLDEVATTRSGGWVAVISHVGPIKAILLAALGLPLDGARRIYLDPATVSLVTWSDASTVRVVNAPVGSGWPDPRWLP